MLVLGAGGWVLLVKPTRTDAKALSVRIADVETKVAERKAELAKPYARLEVRATDLYRLTRALPDRPDVGGVLLQLERLAKGNKVTLQSIVPGTPIAGTGVNELPIAVEVRGRFGNVSSFLGAVQRLTRVKKGRLDATGRLYVVKTVGLGEDTDRGFPNVTGQLGVSAYVFTGPPPPPAAAATDPNATTGEEPTTQSASQSGSAEAAGANP